MVKILEPTNSDTESPKINIRINIDHLDLNMKADGLEHLFRILTHQYEELNKNLSGTIIIYDDNKKTKT
tara:strand:- start:139 stop:345 length:207 start_codon:yes stop_codon:yes gene_type:complete